MVGSVLVCNFSVPTFSYWLGFLDSVFKRAESSVSFSQVNSVGYIISRDDS